MITESASFRPSDEVLRISDGAIIEQPNGLLPSRTFESAVLSPWVMSWYPAQAQPGQHLSYPWVRSTPRGWMIPPHSATGDVIEFGAAYTDTNGVIVSGTVRRWWGWLNYGTTRGLIVKGPYPSLAAAQQDADVVVDMVKMNALDPTKSFDLGSIDPTSDISRTLPLVRGNPGTHSGNDSGSRSEHASDDNQYRPGERQ